MAHDTVQTGQQAVTVSGDGISPLIIVAVIVAVIVILFVILQKNDKKK